MVKGIYTLAKEIKENAIDGQPYDLTFAPTGNLLFEERELLQKYLKARFKLWAESWIIPLADEILSNKR